MKKIVTKLKCKLFGHKWDILYIYGIRVKCKCAKCELEKDDYLSEFL